MKKQTRKRLISLLLVATLFFTSMANSLVMKAGATEMNASSVMSNGDYNVKAVSSFGSLLSDAIDEELNQQTEESGYSVFKVTMENNIATVSFSTKSDATLVVGIYDENNVQMLASGSKNVLADENNVTVTIETDSMPQYYMVRAYLLDTEYFRPLCIEYVTPNYTQKMQEFFAKTTDDFPAERVLNLDDDKTNNFAVYKEETVLISSDGTVNNMISQNIDNQQYTFKNIDETIAALKEGDIFAYNANSTEVVIVKVGTITIEGTTAVIQGVDTSFEEVFEHIKISTSSDMSDMEIAPVDEEGVTYNGLVSVKNTDNMYSAGKVSTEQLSSDSSYGNDVSEKVSTLISLDREIIKGIKISGLVTLSVADTFEFYLTWDYLYFSFRVDFSLSADIGVTGEFPKISIPLNVIYIMPVSGVFVEFVPELEVKASAKASLVGEVSISIGAAFDPDTPAKVTNLTSAKADALDTSLKGSMSIGISINPKVILITEDLAFIKINGGVGIEFVRTPEVGKFGEVSYDAPYSEHGCFACINGDINLYESVSVEVSLARWDKLTLNKKFRDVYKIGDFYYSLEELKGNFGSCPNVNYKITVVVKNNKLEPIVNAMIDNQYRTNSNGEVSFYLPDGRNSFSISKAGYKTAYRTFTMPMTAKRLVVYMDYGNLNAEEKVKGVYLSAEPHYSGGNDYETMAVLTEKGDLYTWGSNDRTVGRKYYYNIPIKILDNIKEFKWHICPDLDRLDVFGYAITNNGDLYSWGPDCGMLGIDSYSSNVPRKILENVQEVSTGYFHAVAKNKLGDVYFWGSAVVSTDSGGVTNKRYPLPVKMFENAKNVIAAGRATYVITNDNELYSWGDNCGQGNKPIEEPTLLLENVERVITDGNYAVAITFDKELYTWHPALVVKLGLGIDGNNNVPVKLMDNVKDVELENNVLAIITDDNSLYLCGDNRRGMFGVDSAEKGDTLPIKIMDNIKSIDLNVDAVYGVETIGAITTEGDLYTWGGYNGAGQLGNGTTSVTPKPVYIMSDVKDVWMDTVCTFILTNSNEVYACGRNRDGVLGVGNTDNCYVPTKIMDDVVSLSPTKFKSIALTSNGEVFVWGDCVNLDNINMVTTSPIKIPISPSYELGIESAIENVYTTLNQQTNTDGTLQATYTGLKADETYAFYVMKDSNLENALSHDNLLYIAQFTADSNGNANINYGLTESYDSPDTFIVPMTQTSINDTEIVLNDLIYNGEEQHVSLLVTYNGNTLTEGTDYEVSGTFAATELGTYQVTITGIGEFIGETVLSYAVVNESQLPTEESTEETSEAPSEVATESVTEESTKETGEVSTEDPAEESTEISTESPIEDATETSGEASTEDAEIATDPSTSQTGIILCNDGKYHYLVDGVTDTTKDGLTNWNGTWYYLEEGIWITDEYDFVDFDGASFLVANGVIADLTGLVLYDGVWYYLANGQLINNYEGLTEYDGEWFYVKNGILVSDFNGIKEYDGGLFLVAEGRILFAHSGLYQNTDGTWYFIASGQVQTQYTGLVLYDNKWFYVVSGILAVDYTGWVEYNGSAFQVINGMVYN